MFPSTREECQTGKRRVSIPTIVGGEPISIYRWYQKKHPAEFGKCVFIKDFGITQATNIHTHHTNKNKQVKKTNGKQISDGSKKYVNTISVFA